MHFGKTERARERKKEIPLSSWKSGGGSNALPSHVKYKKVVEVCMYVASNAMQHIRFYEREGKIFL